MAKPTAAELSNELEDKYNRIKKAYINFKKCPKVRITLGYLNTQIQFLDTYWDEYKEAHVQFLRITTRETRTQYDHFSDENYDACEDTYLSMKTDIQDKINEINKPAEDANTSFIPSVSKSATMDVKLPRLPLPQFSGSYEEWKPFEHSFTALIHNNKSLSEVHKLHYLKSCLSGEASGALKHFQVTDDNYQPAFETLKSRYNHKRLIVNAILNRLFSTRKVNASAPGPLKSFVDAMKECLNSLKNMEICTDTWTPVLIYFAVQKFDNDTHKEWEDHVSKECQKELPEWSTFIDFLENRIHTLEMTATTSSAPRIVKERSYYTATEPVEKSCSHCDEDHVIWHCKKFGKLSPEERSEQAKNGRLCYNCLLPGHSVQYCKQKSSCRICSRRHHSLLHQYRNKEFNVNEDKAQASGTSMHANVEDEPKEDLNSKNDENVTLTSHFAVKRSTALLATALVPVKNDDGNTIILRALIDQGSQATFISERGAQLLKTKRTPVNGKITGVGSSHTTVSHMTNIEVLSRCDPTFNVPVKAYVMSTRITTQLPAKEIHARKWPHIDGLFLADPEFHQPGKIDLLLGVRVYAAIMKDTIIRGPPGTPCAQETYLGWILFGNVDEDSAQETIVSMHLQLDLDHMLKQLWEIDTTGKRALTAEEKLCEKIYEETHTRLPDGRYVVKLPTKVDKLQSTQGGTRNIALKRLDQLERKFKKKPELETEYKKVIEEYIALDQMELVPEAELKNPSVYLPHHAVIREDKETTKVRVVFDASCKGTNNVSLNDELLVGPQIQEDLRNLIMRWRLRKICYIADCQHMYRRIITRKEDCDLQRIVWRQNTEVKDYRLNRVTFGTASAPYLAVKTLHQVAEDEGKPYTKAARTIKEDFYVDDLMSGSFDLLDAIQTANEIMLILEKGGFNLQKWASNSVEFLQQIQPSQRTSLAKIDLKVDGTIKALGLSWNMGEDILEYHLNLPAVSDSITKRSILAEIQRLFDPLGWLGPAIVKAKILIQHLWLLGLEWDQEVDARIKDDWMKMRQDLESVNNIKLERWLQTTDDIETITIHGFCDASTKAYAAVVYLRVITTQGNIHTGIIAAKTRVAPVKPLSLPRLELCGAVLLSRLLKQVKEAIKATNQQTHSWTDSKVVLAWIHGDPARWSTFVSNRVVEILDNIGNQRWYHVRSEENPADIASRGTLMSSLVDDDMWWHGPQWLQTETIPFCKPEQASTDLEKRKEINTNTKIENKDEESYDIFDTLTELQTAIVYAKRFLNSKKKPEAIDIAITTHELEESLNQCVRMAQMKEFEEEITNLKAGKHVKTRSTIKSLNPYLDDQKMLRVGGRLRHADMPERIKHPLILGHNNFLVPLIVADAHRRTLHGGIQLMMCYIRSKYWITRVKSLVKSCIHKCVKCARQQAINRNQIMGDLPKIRITPARPFLHAGVDFAGPVQVLTSRGRGIKCKKAYISIFVCMVTKAIHLELVGDLTSAAFIGAFERFVARRGRCTHIWSDQGTNFVGANKELKELWQLSNLELPGHLEEILAKDGTQWHFNPPYSPNWGGLWEAGVKSTKYHLKRILNKNLTFEELSTTLCQIEACLNSRPLCPIDTTDTDSIEILTPGVSSCPISRPDTLGCGKQF